MQKLKGVSMYKLSIIFCFIILISCKPTKFVSFKMYDFDKKRYFIYSLSLPKGYIMQTWSEENQNLRTYTYSDSAKIFFSDDRAYNRFPKEAYKKYGNNLNLLFIPRDTITVFGQDSVWKNWKISKYYNIEYGYVNVSADKIDSFESILKTFRQKQ